MHLLRQLSLSNLYKKQKQSWSHVANEVTKVCLYTRLALRAVVKEDAVVWCALEESQRTMNGHQQYYTNTTKQYTILRHLVVLLVRFCWGAFPGELVLAIAYLAQCWQLPPRVSVLFSLYLATAYAGRYKCATAISLSPQLALVAHT